ncbi:MAG: D-alanyl-D-alanine carboxypeptidase/D-alanyl-D-alanine-endopeptidase, partial [Nitrospinae bacterium]|nr:D-alanyl-D-alanine carboxypeptidase/D-alanyl-D-alanine-endopeptidase [Nitrospinota bacterium]
VGLRAVNVASGEILLDIHGDTLLIPASTLKLITSAAALQRLSPHYRFRTSFLSVALPEQGEVRGDLFLKGYGDPVLVLEEIWLMARALRTQGIRSIRGDLVGDDSYFDAERRGPAWADPLSQRAFNAKIGALSVNFNRVTILARPGVKPGHSVEVLIEPPSPYLILRNMGVTARQGQGRGLSVNRLEGDAGDTLVIEGSLAVGTPPQVMDRNISNPPLFAGMVMRELLAREGIRVMGRVRVGLAPPEARELHVHRSRALYRVIDDLHKFSNNLIAEQVLKTLGAEVQGPPGSREKGIAVLGDVLAEFGILRGTYTLADGSGMSRFNRVSPAQLVTVLMRMAQDFRVQPEYLASLRSPDAEGRASSRFGHAAFEGRARVKTGTLDDVSALAGYVEPAAGGLVAFATLLNGPFCSMERAWQAQNAVVEQLIALTR